MSNVKEAKVDSNDFIEMSKNNLPDITEEENLRRIKEMEKGVSRIFGVKATLIPTYQLNTQTA